MAVVESEGKVDTGDFEVYAHVIVLNSRRPQIAHLRLEPLLKEICKTYSLE